MNFMENDLILYGSEDQELDWSPFATATLGSEQILARSSNDPYLSFNLVQDYTYINVKIKTAPMSLYSYIDIVSDMGGLWSGVRGVAFLIVYLNTKQQLLLMIVNKLYLTKRVLNSNSGDTEHWFGKVIQKTSKLSFKDLE